MKLAEAEDKASETIASIFKTCSRVEVVGSVRRQRPEVNDLDFLCIPKEGELLFQAIQSISSKVLKNGPKIKTVLDSSGLQYDFYIASPLTYATLLLIRTGSKEHNIRLTSLALSKHWQLKADGTGLVEPVSGDILARTEFEIFDKLGLTYLPPEKRDEGNW